MPPMKTVEWMTGDKFAERFGLTADQVRSLIASGRVSAKIVNIGERRRYVLNAADYLR